MNSIVAMLCGVVAAAGLCATLIAQNQPVKPSTPAAADLRVGDQYPFDACPITGKKFGPLGDVITKVYDGREIRFCCTPCPAKFEADKAASIAIIDAKIIKDQGPLYPLKTSIVTGKDLGLHPYEFVYGNRLIRLGSEGETAAFITDAKMHLGELDKAVIAEQSKTYSLKKCVVCGKEFGSEMGEPVNMVIAGRMIKLCCVSCNKDLERYPAKYITMVDKARHGRTAMPHGENLAPHTHE